MRAGKSSDYFRILTVNCRQVRHQVVCSESRGQSRRLEITEVKASHRHSGPKGHSRLPVSWQEGQVEARIPRETKGREWNEVWRTWCRTQEEDS